MFSANLSVLCCQQTCQSCVVNKLVSPARELLQSTVYSEKRKQERKKRKKKEKGGGGGGEEKKVTIQSLELVSMQTVSFLSRGGRARFTLGESSIKVTFSSRTLQTKSCIYDVHLCGAEKRVCNLTVLAVVDCSG